MVKHLALRREDLSSDPHETGCSGAHVQSQHSYVRMGCGDKFFFLKNKTKSSSETITMGGGFLASVSGTRVAMGTLTFTKPPICRAGNLRVHYNMESVLSASQHPICSPLRRKMVTGQVPRSEFQT